MDWHIECENVWKVFGTDAQGALKEMQERGLGKADIKRELDHIVGVAGVSVKIRRGELFCIMGLSGSGKSTLLRHINRLIEPTSGRVAVNGQDIRKMDDKELSRLRAKTIGMVFQHMALWPHRNLIDNVAYGMEIQGVPSSKRREAASRMLSMMKLDGWEERYPDELSGGMQQRVGIARALASDPDILLMDEPFSALDPLIRRNLQTQFLELSKRLNKTTLFVTHDLEEAVRLGDRIAIMKDGEIVQVGTREEIVLSPADDYVGEFVRPLSKKEFLTAGTIMKPVSEISVADFKRPSHLLPADAEVELVISKLASVGEPIGIVQGEALVGVIDPYSVLAALRTA